MLRIALLAALVLAPAALADGGPSPGVDQGSYGLLSAGNLSSTSAGAVDQTGDLTTMLEEAARGIRVLKSFGRGDEMFKRYDADCRRLRTTELERVRIHTQFIWVLGREFGVNVLSLVTGVPRDELLPMLDEAIGARMRTEVAGVHGRLRFAQVLIREQLS